MSGEWVRYLGIAEVLIAISCGCYLFESFKRLMPTALIVAGYAFGAMLGLTGGAMLLNAMLGGIRVNAGQQLITYGFAPLVLVVAASTVVLGRSGFQRWRDQRRE